MGVRSVIASYFENTTAHGFPIISRSKNWFRRLFWIIVVSGALILLAYQLYSVIQEFLEYPKTVTMEVMDPSSVQFPAISICSLHVLNASRIRDSDNTEDGGSVFHDLAKMNNKSNKTANGTSKTKREISNLALREYRSEIEKNVKVLIDKNYPMINLEIRQKRSLDLKKPTDVAGSITKNLTNSIKNPLVNNQSLKPNPVNPGKAISNVVIANSNSTNNNNTLKNNPVGDVFNKLNPLNPAGAIKDVAGNISDKASSLTPKIPELPKDMQNLIEKSVLGKVTETLLSQVTALTSNLTDVVTKQVLSKILDAEIINQLTKLVTKAIIPELAKILVDTGVGTILNGVVSSQLIDSVTDILGSVPSLLKDVLQKPMSRDDFKKFGIQAKDFILGCSFDKEACTYRNFTQWQNERYGNCFTFNGEKSLGNMTSTIYETRKYGSGYGLRLLLKITSKEEDMPIFSSNSGVRIVVHSSDDWAYPEDQGMNVPPRMAASIAINKKVVNRITPPHGKCTNDTKIYNWDKISNGLRYSRKGCVKICRTKAILKECKCAQDMRIAEFLDPNAPQCNSETQTSVSCVERVLAKVNCTCDPGCLEESFDANIAYSQINSEHLCVAGMMGLNDGIVDKSLCDVDPHVLVSAGIYFSGLSYEQVTETPTYTLASLLSNMGGTMGLFLGISVISIIEIFELIFDIFLSCFCCCCLTNSNKTPVKPVT